MINTANTNSVPKNELSRPNDLEFGEMPKLIKGHLSVKYFFYISPKANQFIYNIVPRSSLALMVFNDFGNSFVNVSKKWITM